MTPAQRNARDALGNSARFQAGAAGANSNTPPTALTEAVAAANLSLNYLVATSSVDGEFRGTTPSEQFKFFALNEVPEGMRQQQNQQRSYVDRDAEARTAMAGTQAQVVEASIRQSTPAPEREVARTTGMDFFQGIGYPQHVAAGIMGNLEAESGLNPTVPNGDGGRAMSLAQWHPDRQATAQREGFDLTDFNSALAFVDWELKNTESAAGQRLRNASNVQEAADIFAQYYLRPQGAQTGDPNRIHNITGRRQNARNAMGPRR